MGYFLELMLLWGAGSATRLQVNTLSMTEESVTSELKLSAVWSDMHLLSNRGCSNDLLCGNEKIMALHNIAGVLMAGVYWRNAPYEAVLKETISSMHWLQFELIHENQWDSSAKQQQKQQKTILAIYNQRQHDFLLQMLVWLPFTPPPQLAPSLFQTGLM